MALRESDPAEVGGYRIEDRLGSGGMGVVYLARSDSGRRLALKVVHAQYADDDEFRIRFRREVAAARQVSGAFTAPVVDADADAPRPWMATLYIPGEDLGTHVRRHGPLPLPKLYELAAGLAEAIRDIHRAGMVHRDLKPANVMLAEDGPRVIDFGISRAAEFAASDVLTQTGRVMGTPPFMSPEQFSSPQDVGPAADVFSLGSVVAYAATGHGPFDSPSPYETAVRVVDGAAEIDDVPPELLPFVQLCLEKHPKSRPSPDELLRLLRNGEMPGPRSEPDSGTPRDEQPSTPRRRKRLILLSALSALLVAAATTLTVMSVNAEPTPVAGDLPSGWQAWHKRSKDPSPDKDPIGPSSPFNRCAATGRSLVCAGDDVMATRFALADGRNTWARSIDETADDLGGSSAGTIIGARGGSVYVYGADDRPVDGDGLSKTRYTVQALDAETGKARWKTVTGDGDGATEPNREHGASIAVPAGVITVYGDDSKYYALLGADDGKVRWKRPLPDQETDPCLLRAADRQAYLLCARLTGDDITGTSVTRLDPATGRPDWTVKIKGDQDIAGQADGRLVLAGVTGTHRTVTLINAESHVVTTARLATAQPEGASLYVLRGTLYFTLPGGSVRAVDPGTGRQLWKTDSTVEQSGPPAASATRLYLASPSGRLAAIDVRTGRVTGTRAGRDDGGDLDVATSITAPPVLVGDALYVPYGLRAVYTADVRDL
ncbi:protein kinase [Streptomyces ferrugineus]|uniref:Protein kinase n=1 Tax=Streptomyces ferrugineus TaxID=1413221 RepID=A0A7M2SQS9_9ACTN|nr:PQQ-binding-like beta-propeller repeat protein [Streptomyces ferrugineus]QOV38329.1 protein kinase [Streptomyces ferrugineus]